jgi:hypothetical protein
MGNFQVEKQKDAVDLPKNDRFINARVYRCGNILLLYILPKEGPQA